MGACASTPRGCVRVGSGLNLRNKHRRRRRRIKAQSSSHNKLSKVEPSCSSELSYRNPKYQGNPEAWYDTDTVIDSDCDDHDDDFYSVQDDMSQIGAGSTAVTPRRGDDKHFNVIVLSSILTKSSEPSSNNLEEYTAKDASAKESDDNHDKKKDPSNFDKASAKCMDGSSGRTDTEALQSRSLLPRVVCSSSSEEKIRSPGPHSPSVKKRIALKLSNGEDLLILHHCCQGLLCKDLWQVLRSELPIREKNVQQLVMHRS